MTQSTSERPNLGGTDGFRGEYTTMPGHGLMNEQTIADMTFTLVNRQLGLGSGSDLVVIGQDTRVFNDLFAKAARDGAEYAGGNVAYLGIAPTPAILRTAKTLGACAAVALTSSHNPAEYGGWKGTYGSEKPYGDEVRDLDSRYWTGVDSGLVVPLTYKRMERQTEYTKDYIADVVASIREKFGGERPLEGKLVVIDTARGAARDITPKVFERLGARVERFACDDKGDINDGCGATDLDGVKQFLLNRPDLVKDPGFLGAFTNDGDADRMIGVGAVVKDGEVVFEDFDGNRMLEIMAQGQAGVVGTDYTNDASIRRIEATGTKFEFCRNGDVEVTNALRAHDPATESGWTRGSEFTGHHVDLEWLSSGDGVRTAAWLAAHVAAHGTNLYELARTMPLMPEKMIKLELPTGTDRARVKELFKTSQVMEIVRRTELDAAYGYRNLARGSGTEDLIRVWGSGDDKPYTEARTAEIAQALYEVVAA